MIDLARVMELPAPPAKVWETLWDIPALARCIPGCEDVREIEPGRRYRATVRERVGPFSVTIPLEVVVEAAVDPQRLSVTATGRDSAVGSPVKVTLTAVLDGVEGRTRLTLDGRADVGGKLAALGQGVIQRRARDILDTFAKNLDRLLRERVDASAV